MAMNRFTNYSLQNEVYTGCSFNIDIRSAPHWETEGLRFKQVKPPSKYYETVLFCFAVSVIAIQKNKQKSLHKELIYLCNN